MGEKSWICISTGAGACQRIEWEEKMLINGKPVKDYADLPHGAFTRIIRDTIDPNYGKPADEPQLVSYLVEVSYSYSGRGTAYIDVKAESQEQAEALAMKEFRQRDIDTFDAVVDDVEITGYTKGIL